MRFTRIFITVLALTSFDSFAASMGEIVNGKISSLEKNKVVIETDSGKKVHVSRALIEKRIGHPVKYGEQVSLNIKKSEATKVE